MTRRVRMSMSLRSRPHLAVLLLTPTSPARFFVAAPSIPPPPLAWGSNDVTAPVMITSAPSIRPPSASRPSSTSPDSPSAISSASSATSSWLARTMKRSSLTSAVESISPTARAMSGSQSLAFDLI